MPGLGRRIGGRLGPRGRFAPTTLGRSRGHSRTVPGRPGYNEGHGLVCRVGRHSNLPPPCSASSRRDAGRSAMGPAYRLDSDGTVRMDRHLEGLREKPRSPLGGIRR